MVLDNVRYHDAKRLKPILERYKSRLELVFLPPHSPDLNPMERIWWYMPKKRTHNLYVESIETRIEAFEAFMEGFKMENPTGKRLAN
jgi:putative transposase